MPPSQGLHLAAQFSIASDLSIVQDAKGIDHGDGAAGRGVGVLLLQFVPVIHVGIVDADLAPISVSFRTTISLPL